MKFFEKLVLIASFLFGGFLNHLSNRNCFTSEYHMHCEQTRLSLAANALCTGEEHFWSWKRMRLALRAWIHLHARTLSALETNAFRTGDEHLRTIRT